MTGLRKSGFTLVEMLVVIVIIGIITALAIPAATKLMKSGGLNGATREVANTLGLARQYAITHRVNTRVIFPNVQTAVGNPAFTNLAPWYQSYAVITDETVPKYVSKWEHLPIGTIFMDAGSAIDVTVGNPPSVDNLGTVNVPFPNTNVITGAAQLTWLACVEFNTFGAATQAGTLTITEGFMNGNQPTPTSKNPGTLANAATISVDALVGRVLVTRP